MQLPSQLSEISVKGKSIKVPAICIHHRTVIVNGKLIRIAEVQDEEWIAGDVVEDPEYFIAQIKRANLKADIFTFTEKIPATEPKYGYPMEWDNVAAIPITSFEDWWEKRLPQESRKNVRRATKRGVNVEQVEFNDELVKSIF